MVSVATIQDKRLSDVPDLADPRVGSASRSLGLKSDAILNSPALDETERDLSYVVQARLIGSQLAQRDTQCVLESENLQNVRTTPTAAIQEFYGKLETTKRL